MKKALTVFLTLALLLALAVPALATGEDFEIQDGVLTKYNGAGGDVVIPDGVTVIGQGVFSSRNDLTSVTIPDGVTEIRMDAFAHNDNLTSVTIPASVTTFGEYCFAYCKNLVRVTVPESTTDFGYRAFHDTPWLASLGEFPTVNGTLLEYIGSDSAVTIPQGVKAIGRSAFFINKTITSVVIPEGVTSIGYSAFAECTNLSDVTLPKSITEVSCRAFANTPWVAGQGEFVILCGVLLKYNGPGGAVTIPGGVKVIDAAAFNNSPVTSVTIPEGVTAIWGNYVWGGAFSGSRSLTAVSIPKSLTGFGPCVFTGSGLKDVYYAGTEEEWQQLRGVKIEGAVPNIEFLTATIHYNAALVPVPVHPSAATEDPWITGAQYVGDTLTLAADDGVSAPVFLAAYNENGKLAGVFAAKCENGVYTLPIGADAAKYEWKLMFVDAENAAPLTCFYQLDFTV